MPERARKVASTAGSATVVAAIALGTGALGLLPALGAVPGSPEMDWSGMRLVQPFSPGTLSTGSQAEIVPIVRLAASGTGNNNGNGNVGNGFGNNTNGNNLGNGAGWSAPSSPAGGSPSSPSGPGSTPGDGPGSGSSTGGGNSPGHSPDGGHSPGGSASGHTGDSAGGAGQSGGGRPVDMGPRPDIRSLFGSWPWSGWGAGRPALPEHPVRDFKRGRRAAHP